MRNMTVNSKLLLRLEVKSGLSPEQITARIQDLGIRFTYRQYKNLIKTGRLPNQNGNDVLEGLEKVLNSKIPLMDFDKAA